MIRKYYFLTALFISCLLSIPTGITDIKAADNQQQTDSTVTITITAVGDLMCHSVQFKYAEVKLDSFDFNPVFRYVTPLLKESNLIIGNLETVLAGKQKGYKGYPYFNAPDEFLQAIANAGFNLINTANNHALDQGYKGVFRTIEQIKDNHLSYCGTFLSEDDRDSIRLFSLKGIRLAFLSYSFSTNDYPIPKDKPYLINLIDYKKIEYDIKKARNDGADIILVHFHFGEEYNRQPTDYQKEVVKKTISLGADLIIGDHPHVIEPVEFFNRNNQDKPVKIDTLPLTIKTNYSKLNTSFAAYSLGNFISNQRWRYSDAGVILKINITKDFTTDSIFIKDINFIPTWVFKGLTADGYRYYILPDRKNLTDSTYSFLNRTDFFKMKQAFEDTRLILNDHLDSLQQTKFTEFKQ
jgi:poly-gamma-glutamate capsule biosynthesis protein CapA/YwtB (metallophosphatase superfamily)